MCTRKKKMCAVGGPGANEEQARNVLTLATMPVRWGGPVKRRNFVAALGATAVVMPCAVRAQQGKRPVVGWLHTLSADRSTPVIGAFREGLRDASYIEGENIAIEYRWAEGHYDRLPALATDLVGTRLM